jgi:peptidyl-prolyl cis-trans isomerase SurA
MNIFSRKILGLVCACAFTVAAAPELFESIAAVVDGKPIMRSEVMTSLYQVQGSPGFAQLSERDQMRQVLDKLIEEKVLLSRVTRDSIVVEEAELQQRVDSHLKGLAARQKVDLATLEKAIQAQLGLNMAQYRKQLSEQIREQMVLARIRQRHVGMVSPTRKEVESFYAEYKDSLPRQYNTIQVSHIELAIEPSKAIVDSVNNLAMLLVDSLDRGVSWDVLAARHSQDSSAAKGGDIGYYRKGSLEPEYERIAWRLENGKYTDAPVKTRLGWHLIRSLGKKDEGMRTAQILLTTKPSAADSAQVILRADSIRTVALGGSSFAELAKQYSTDKETAYRGGNLGWFERGELDSAYVQTVSRLGVGEISEPVLIENSYHLFRLDDERQLREYTLEEDYVRIEEMASTYIGNKKLQTLVNRWKQEVHIDIRLWK